MNYLNDTKIIVILKTILTYILIVFITTMIYCYYTSETVKREGFGAAWAKMGEVFDPDKNGFAKVMNPATNGIGAAFDNALDPRKNGIGYTLNPETNGIASFFSEIGEQFYELGVNEWNDDVDTIDNGLIFFEIFLKKTVPAFFKEFLGSYWRCFVKMLLNLYKCIIYYTLDSVGQILYLPIRFIVWLFCLQFQEGEFWDAVYELDNTFSCAYGFHLVHYPDSIIQDCYVCDIASTMPLMPLKPVAKRTPAPPMFNDPDFLEKHIDNKLNPAKNGVAKALDPDENGVGDKFRWAFDPKNPNSIVNTGQVIEDVFEEFGELFAEGMAEIYYTIEKEVVKSAYVVLDGINTAINETMKILKDIKTEIVDQFNMIKDKIVSFFTGFGYMIKNFFEQAFRKVVDTLRGAFDQVVGFFKNIKNRIIRVFMDIVDEITGLVKRIIGFIKGLADKIKGFFTGAFNTVKDGVVGAVNKVGDGVKSAARKVGGFFKKLFR